MTEDQFAGHQGPDLFDAEKTKLKLVPLIIHLFRTIGPQYVHRVREGYRLYYTCLKCASSKQDLVKY